MNFIHSFGRIFVARLLVLLTLAFPFSLEAEDGHWVLSWGTALQLTEPNNLPPVPLAEKTLRQFVRTSIPAETIRLRFSNAYGDSPMRINSAHIANAAGQGSAGDGDIDPATSRQLAFKGSPGVVIAPGQWVLSDPMSFSMEALATVSISIHFGEVSASAVTGHPGSRTTSFIVEGDKTKAATLPGSSRTEHWYAIQNIEVLAPEGARSVMILGDSITDGRGSVTNGQGRWPDFFATRLAGNPATADVGVGNMGIGGNAIFGGLGPAAVNRFRRDILDQPGVRYLIIFEGVNDIGYAPNTGVATNLINAYKDFATQAKARGIKVYGATITPFKGSGYYSAVHEEVRQLVNNWMRTSPDLDALIDFDAAVRDPNELESLLPAYSSDSLHLSPAGLEALADSIDLTLFEP